MKNKSISMIFILLFLLLSLIPSIGMLFQGEVKAAANETLASAPELTGRDGKLNIAVLKQTSDYVSDRLFMRKPLITAWAELNAALLRSSANESVVLGSDGWLYFSDSLDDYRGRSMEEDALRRAAENLSRMQAFAKKNGIRFLFTVAPNKNSLYPEHMPHSIPHEHELSSIERLLPYLEEYGIHYVDLFSAFAEAGECYYYKTDSHWTDQGAALAADALLHAAEKESAYFSGAFNKGEDHRGDLYEMLYPSGSLREESLVYAPFTFQSLNNPNGGNALRILTHNESASGKLFCWRDSFGISLYPYLAESYSDALFSRSESYDLNQVLSFKADTLVLEIVERNLPRLAEMDLTIPD